MVSALDEQFAMTRLARDRGWDAVGTGQHYLSEGMTQLQLIPFLARLAAEAGEMTRVAGVLLLNLHNPVEVAECIATWFVNPHATMASITRQMGLYRAELARLGKPLPRVRPLIKEIYCATDRRTALELAGPYLGAMYRDYTSWVQDAVLLDGDTFRQPFEELLRDRFVLGSPEECYEQLRPCWEAAGANFLFFRTHWLGMPLAHALASMRLVSDELLPALRKIRA